jgi:TolB protein
MHKLMLVTPLVALLATVPAGSGGTASQSGHRSLTAAHCAVPGACFVLTSTIAFTSTRDDPVDSPFISAEIYLMNPDPANPRPRRLTDNAYGDGFPALSPDGKKIVFDSNRNRTADEPPNTSDLFLMDTDGSEQTLLTRGSSATWSPNSRNIAFHASASGTGTPIRTDPGSATTDSDIFTANVDDLLTGAAQARNITNTPDRIDDDPDWSPDGQRIVFTSHDVGDDPRLSNTAEIYVINADGSGAAQRLTDNTEEERAPAWSPDGSRIVFSCRIGGGTADFEICMMNADGTGLVQLTDNSVPDLTATWSPDGDRILFHRQVPGQGFQLFTMNPDGTGQTQLTSPPGLNLLAHWGRLRVLDKHSGQ